MDRWKWCRDGRAKSSQKRCPPMLHARRLRSHAALSTAVPHPAARRSVGDAPCPHAPDRAAARRGCRPLGLARHPARGRACLRPARDTIRSRPPRDRHRGAGALRGARAAGRHGAVRGSRRGSPGRVDRPCRRAGVELRARAADGGGRRDGRARAADRGAAARPHARQLPAASGRSPRWRLRRPARAAGGRSPRAAAPHRRSVAPAPPSAQARGCAVRYALARRSRETCV